MDVTSSIDEIIIDICSVLSKLFRGNMNVDDNLAEIVKALAELISARAQLGGSDHNDASELVAALKKYISCMSK